MAEENQGGFKVTDRRLFNPDGTPREEALAEEAAAPAQPEPKNEPAAPTPAPAAAQTAPPPAHPVEDLDAPQEQTMFMEFLMEIASSAFVYLGLVEHPATGRRQVDLRAAKASIDMLSMLREKTNGNLTPGEQKFFENLLADLQMQFISMRR